MQQAHGFALVPALAAAWVLLLAVPGPAAHAAEPLSISELMTGGWQIAGYTSTFDNRSALLLFKHPHEAYLVQCLAGYDVTRTPRTYVNCYELK